jgi:hypothetical protein
MASVFALGCQEELKCLVIFQAQADQGHQRTPKQACSQCVISRARSRDDPGLSPELVTRCQPTLHYCHVLLKCFCLCFINSRFILICTCLCPLCAGPFPHHTAGCALHLCFKYIGDCLTRTSVFDQRRLNMQLFVRGLQGGWSPVLSLQECDTIADLKAAIEVRSMFWYPRPAIGLPLAACMMLLFCPVQLLLALVHPHASCLMQPAVLPPDPIVSGTQSFVIMVCMCAAC